MSDTHETQSTQSHSNRMGILPFMRTRSRAACPGNTQEGFGETKEEDNVDTGNDSSQASPVRTSRNTASSFDARIDDRPRIMDQSSELSYVTIKHQPTFWTSDNPTSENLISEQPIIDQAKKNDDEPRWFQFGLVLEGSDHAKLIGRDKIAEIDLQPGLESKENTQFFVSQDGSFSNGNECPSEIQTKHAGHWVKLETGTIAVQHSVHFGTNILLTVRVLDIKRSKDSWTFDVPKSGIVRVKFHFVLDSYFDSFIMRSVFLVLLWAESLIVSDSEYSSLSQVSPYRIMKSQFLARTVPSKAGEGQTADTAKLSTQTFLGQNLNVEDDPQVLEFQKLFLSPDMILFLLGTLWVGILYWANSGPVPFSLVILGYSIVFVWLMFHPQIAQGSNTVDISTTVDTLKA